MLPDGVCAKFADPLAEEDVGDGDSGGLGVWSVPARDDPEVEGSVSVVWYV